MHNKCKKRKLWHFTTDRYKSYFLFNTETSSTIVGKKYWQHCWKKTDQIYSIVDDPANTELLSVKYSDTTTDFISRTKLCISMFKDEPPYLHPDSSQARSSLDIFPQHYLGPGDLHFWPGFWVSCQWIVNKWEWGLLKQPLCTHLTFPDI